MKSIMSFVFLMLLGVSISAGMGYFTGAALDINPGMMAGIFTGAGLVASFIPAAKGTLFMGFTPQNKIIQQGGKFGQKSLKNQQGTTRHIWDTLELVPGQFYYRFFEGVNTRAFPLTNLTDNKLEAGESLACQYLILSVLSKTSESGWGKPGVLSDPMLLGDLNMELMNTIVMKPISLLPFISTFNRMPNSAGNVYKLFTHQTILPLTPFFFTMHVPQLPTAQAGETLYVRLTVKGTGSILSPKGTL